MKKIIILVATVVFSAAVGPAFGQDAHAGHAGHAGHAASAGQSAAALELTDGEVRKVDREAGKITLRHAELKNLGMGAMTMVFRVRDPAMLSEVKAGDKVKFAAEKIDGAITIVNMEKR